MPRDTRQKASDVFRETNFLLGEKVAFAKAFPSIETLRVEVEEDGEGVRYEWGRVSVYTQDRAGEYINCSNSLCYNGGFRLGDNGDDLNLPGSDIVEHPKIPDPQPVLRMVRSRSALIRLLLVLIGSCRKCRSIASRTATRS